MPIGKNANLAWKEYKVAGGTLGFTDFLDREKKKIYSANGQDDSILIINQHLNQQVQDAIDKTLAAGGLKKDASKKTILGINKTAFIIGGVVITAAIIFFIVSKKHKS